MADRFGWSDRIWTLDGRGWRRNGPAAAGLVGHSALSDYVTLVSAIHGTGFNITIVAI
jgi:hypothetical protein